LPAIKHTVKTLHDSALYQFMPDIDIDIDIEGYNTYQLH